MLIISDYLKRKQKIIDGKLNELLPKDSEEPKTLHKAMRHSIFAGGKRIRPVLMLAIAEAYSCPAEKMLPLSCAIEMIHTGSLIFDDLPPIDNAELRRGLPTCHRLYGDATAMLACYSLVARAVGVVSESVSRDSAMLAEISAELSSAIGSTGMAGGQLVELESDTKAPEKPIIEYVYLNKTARLFMAAARSACIVASVPERDKSIIVGFAKELGMAFQLRDDILDVESLGSTLGKDTGKNRQQSLVNLYGVDKSRGLLAKYAANAKKFVSSLKSIDSEAQDRLLSIIAIVAERER